jgi:BlaR1 peptidase M56
MCKRPCFIWPVSPLSRAPLTAGCQALLQSRLGSGLSGSREFAFSAYGIWLAGRLYKECAAGACVAPQTLGKESLLVSAPNCGFHGRCFFWNPALPAVPVVLGHFRPLILLPIGLLAGLPPPQMEAVLVHELAHIRRHDYLMNLFQRFAEGLLFYHPAVWWFARVMRNEQEKCCDDVVRFGHRPSARIRACPCRARAKQVPRPANGHCGHRRKSHETGPSFAVSQTVGRSLVDVTRRGGFFRHRMRVGCRLAIRAIEAKPHPVCDCEISLFPMAERGVVYIIDDAERAAFQKLATDQERDHFIEEFWSVAMLLPARPKTSLSSSTTTGLPTPTSIFRQRPVPRAGRPIAATCLWSMARRTRLTLTPKGLGGPSPPRFGPIVTSRVSATTNSLPSLTGPGAATIDLPRETPTETRASIAAFTRATAQSEQ